MKNYGKLVDYDGMFGHITAVDGKKYVVLDKDMLEQDLTPSDYVEFVGENYSTVETNIDIARFVKRMDKNMTEEQKKSSYSK